MTLKAILDKARLGHPQGRGAHGRRRIEADPAGRGRVFRASMSPKSRRAPMTLVGEFDAATCVAPRRRRRRRAVRRARRRWTICCRRSAGPRRCSPSTPPAPIRCCATRARPMRWRRCSASSSAMQEARTPPRRCSTARPSRPTPSASRMRSTGSSCCFGKDFPVLPRFALGPYAAEFNASLAEQPQLTTDDPWRINGWLTQLARVREGADRFAAGVVGARGVGGAAGARTTSKWCSFHIAQEKIWAALPEAWVEAEGTTVRSDAGARGTARLSRAAARRAVSATSIASRRISRSLCMRPAWTRRARGGQTVACFVCDEWPEFVPDPFQTAAIGFHYDAPGARPPQTILLAMPPQLGQAAWSFDDAVDVIHEAFDLAKLRSVRPRDLAGGLGALLPGNYLPHTYTDDLPSVQVLEMLREARADAAGVRWQRQRPCSRSARFDRRQDRRRALRVHEVARHRSNFVGAKTPSITGITRLETQPTAIDMRPAWRRRWPTRCGCCRASGSSTNFKAKTRARRCA